MPEGKIFHVYVINKWNLNLSNAGLLVFYFSNEMLNIEVQEILNNTKWISYEIISNGSMNGNNRNSPNFTTLPLARFKF